MEIKKVMLVGLISLWCALATTFVLVLQNTFEVDILTGMLVVFIGVSIYQTTMCLIELLETMEEDDYL